MAALLPANAQTIWNDLIAGGATPVQAAGIMGNMLHEDSQMDPELVALDSNGAYSRGLVMWNDQGAGSGVNWAQYITGNVTQDLGSQVNLIVAQGGLAKAAGPDAYTAGVNFAHDFEACRECGYPGTSELPKRGASATMVYQVAQSGNWNLGGGLPTPGQSPASPGQPSAAPVLTSFDLLRSPLSEAEGIFSGLIGGVESGFGLIKGVEKVYQGTTRLLAALLSASTWIRLGEVYLGVLTASAGLALIAITLAESHPGALLDVVSLIPGEGQVARAATGVARGATTGSAVRAAAGGAAGARTARRSAGARTAPRSAVARRQSSPPPAGRRAPTAGAGRDVRAAGRQAAGTARRAQGGGVYSASFQAAERRRQRERGHAYIAGRYPDADDLDAARAARARRENRQVARRLTARRADTSDLRRRTP